LSQIRRLDKYGAPYNRRHCGGRTIALRAETEGP
jgi:hypothetical protein